MRAVVKLGGALFRREPNVTALRDMGKVLGVFVEEGNQLVVVAGGGENARMYIATARKLGGDESTCDLLGIQLTRANAELLRLAIGLTASSKIPTTLSDLPHLAGSGKAVVMGGLQPGQSTNAMLWLRLRLRLLELRFLLMVLMWTAFIRRIRRRTRERSSSDLFTWTNC